MRRIPFQTEINGNVPVSADLLNLAANVFRNVRDVMTKHENIQVRTRAHGPAGIAAKKADRHPMPTGHGTHGICRRVQLLEPASLPFSHDGFEACHFRLRLLSRPERSLPARRFPDPAVKGDAREFGEFRGVEPSPTLEEREDSHEGFVQMSVSF